MEENKERKTTRKWTKKRISKQREAHRQETKTENSKRASSIHKSPLSLTFLLLHLSFVATWRLEIRGARDDLGVNIGEGGVLVAVQWRENVSVPLNVTGTARRHLEEGRKGEWMACEEALRVKACGYLTQKRVMISWMCREHNVRILNMEVKGCEAKVHQESFCCYLTSKRARLM